MNFSDVNLVLASLEEVSCFRQTELKLAALLGKYSLCKVPQMRLEGKSSEFIFINGAYPKFFYAWNKSKGMMTTSKTSFLSLREVKIFIRYALPELMTEEDRHRTDHPLKCGIPTPEEKRCKNNKLYFSSMCRDCLMRLEPYQFISNYERVQTYLND